MSYMKPADSSRPHIIIMVGIPGSGKSFFAERFAETFKAPYISYNKLSQDIFNKTDLNEAELATIEKIADYFLNEAFKSNRTIIYEGGTDQRSQRLALAKKANKAGYDPMFVWVQTEVNYAKKRALKLSKDYRAISEEQFEDRLKKFSPPHYLEKSVVISGKHTYNTQLKTVLKNIIKPTTTSIIAKDIPVRLNNKLIQ